MNVRLIARALHALSLLTDDDFDLLMKLRQLNQAEREALVGVLEPAKPAKKAAKKSPQKSRKAASLAGAIAGTAGNKPATPTCQFAVNGAEVCGATEDDVIHDMTYSSSHEFVRGGQAVGASGD